MTHPIDPAIDNILNQINLSLFPQAMPQALPQAMPSASPLNHAPLQSFPSFIFHDSDSSLPNQDNSLVIDFASITNLACPACNKQSLQRIFNTPQYICNSCNKLFDDSQII